MRREEDDFASIDIAVTFFAAVLMLFALIQFNFTDHAPKEPKASVGQTYQSAETIVPAWQTVPLRSGVALLRDDRLTILDMAQLSLGVADLDEASQGSSGWTLWSRAGMAATPPNAFLLEIYTAFSSPPEAWVAHDLTLTGDVPCPDDLRPSLVVFVLADAAALSPALAFSERCGTDLRFEYLDSETDPNRIATPIRIGLSPAAYSRERMFR